MPWHDETPWARRKRKREQEAAEAAARALREERVEDIRRALESYDRGGMSLDRFIQNVETIARGGITKVGESHKPEVQG